MRSFACVKESSTILTITGSDGTGLSGVQADMKTISALGGYAMSAITCITVQNTLGIQEFYDLPAAVVRSQIEAVVNDIEPQVIKVGLDSFGRNARRHHRRNPALPSALRGLCPCFGLCQGRPTDGRGRADTDPASPHPALYARRPTAAHAPRRTKHLLQCGGGLSEPKLLHRGGTGAGRTVCQGNDGTHGGATGTKHGTLPGVCLGSGAACEDQ